MSPIERMTRIRQAAHQCHPCIISDIRDSLQRVGALNEDAMNRLLWVVVGLVAFSCSLLSGDAEGQESKRPNILLAIADDWSWPHAGAYGCKFVKTPAFDRVAREGVLFTQAFCASPGCSPSRAALLTGRHTWELEHAGTHASSFSDKLVVYPDLLEEAGYFVGFTGKGWGPGNFQAGGRSRNPAGPAFSQIKLDPPLKGISGTDYAANFQAFLAKRPKGQPFCFWYGGQEPHRAYEKGAGLKAGKRAEDAEVPPFLPDTPEVRSDLLDYCAWRSNTSISTWAACSKRLRRPASWRTRSSW